jgi:hypothetical protein
MRMLSTTLILNGSIIVVIARASWNYASVKIAALILTGNDENDAISRQCINKWVSGHALGVRLEFGSWNSGQQAAGSDQQDDFQSGDQSPHSKRGALFTIVFGSLSP